MSSRKSVEWIERLVLGSPGSDEPPPEWIPLVLNLQAKGVSVNGAMRNGGLVRSHTLLIGDLDRCLEHFDRRDDTPTFQTGAVTRFYNHASVLLAKRPEETPVVSVPDEAILDSILRGDDASTRYDYSSAHYWGEVARRLLNDLRPVRGLEPAGAVPDRYLRNAVRLYDVTIKTLGRRVDPMTMILLPDRTLHVDPAHFASPVALEAFAQLCPDHALSRSVRLLLGRCVDELLEGQMLAVLGKHERLESFLTNVLVVHHHVHRVTGEDEPPRLVDVFQRLLAMAQLDYLWQRRDVKEKDSSSSSSPGVFGLTSRILRLEKQNAFLLEHFQKQ